MDESAAFLICAALKKVGLNDFESQVILFTLRTEKDVEITDELVGWDVDGNFLLLIERKRSLYRLTKVGLLLSQLLMGVGFLGRHHLLLNLEVVVGWSEVLGYLWVERNRMLLNRRLEQRKTCVWIVLVIKLVTMHRRLKLMIPHRHLGWLVLVWNPVLRKVACWLIVMPLVTLMWNLHAMVKIKVLGHRLI